MIDTKQLEKRWFKYKFKSYLIYLIIFIGVIIFILTLFILSNIFIKDDIPINKTVQIPKIEKIIVKKKEVAKTEIIDKNITKKIKKIAIKKIEKKEVVKQLVVEPSFDFISQIEIALDNEEKKEKESYRFQKREEAREIEKVQKKVAEKKVTSSKEKYQEKPIVEVKKVQRERKSPLTIVRQNTQQDIKNVIKRFEKNNNPALSLFIARQYYEMKEYKKAYNYALTTNGIDNDIEESWIIFAKALIKLDKKSIAIKMLHKYIAHSNSYRAISLLDDINSGEFQ